jgi:nitric oxide reductase large subunit
MTADQPITITQQRPHNNRTAWIIAIVIALIVALAAVLFYAKQARDREDQKVSDLVCAMQADAAGASSWQIVDGRCVVG